MKTLIVDDDISTVNTICQYTQWEALGIDQIFTAYAAAGAKEIIWKERPEIIVCDIEMPMGSGLDLLRWERERNLGAQFVFLTCHDRFEFAAEAIQHQAAEYILKPYEPVRMMEALQRAIERISQRERLQRDSDLWQENRKAVEKEFWKDVLFWQIPSERDAIFKEARRRGVELPAGESAIVLLSITEKEPQNGKLHSAEEESGLEHILRGLVHTYLKENSICTPVFYRNEAGAFAGICVVKSGGEAWKSCQNLLRISEKVLTGSEMTCYIAADISLEQLGNVREEMERMDLDNISRRGKLIRWKKYVPRDGAVKQPALEGLYPLLIGGERLKIMKTLQRQIEETAMQAELTPDILYAFQQDIVQEAYVYLHKNGIRPDLLFGDKVSIQMMRSASSSKYAMMKWISYFFNRLIDFDEKRKRSESIVAQAKRYIESNYQEDISRNEVAGCVFLTPEYLAKIFKREMGISINTYIADCRLRRAQALLSDTRMNIGQIAAEVGFNGLPYFISSFKKKFGISPTEYRRSTESASEMP